MSHLSKEEEVKSWLNSQKGKLPLVYHLAIIKEKKTREEEGIQDKKKIIGSSFYQTNFYSVAPFYKPISTIYQPINDER